MRSPILILGFLLVAVLSTALVVPYFVDWTAFRGTLERWAEDLTGRAVAIDGEVSVRLLPQPELRLSGLRIANPPHAAEPDFLAVERLEARFALAALLQGRVRATSVSLYRPTIALERLAPQRGSSWTFTPRGRPDRLLPIRDLELGRIAVRDGSIILRDHSRGGAARLDNVEATVAAASLTGPYRIRGRAGYEGDPIDIAISTGKWHTGQPMKLSVRLLPQDAGVAYTLDGEFEAAAAEDPLRGTLRIGREGAPHAGSREGPDGELPFLIRSQLSANFARVRLSELEVAFDDVETPLNALQGEATVTLGRSIRLAAALRSNRLDLDRLFGSANLDRGTLLRRLAHAAASLPDGVEVEVALEAAAVIAGGDTMEAAEVAVSADARRLAVRKFAATMPGQTRLVLSGLLPADPQEAAFSGDVRLESASVRDFAQWALPAMRPTIEQHWTGQRGRGELAGRLEASPRSLRLAGTSISLDGAKATGSFDYRIVERPLIDLRLAADSIDIDRYLAPGSSASDAPGSLARLLRQLAGLRFGDATLSLRLQSDRLRLGSVEIEDPTIDAGIAPSGLDLRTFELGRIGDARVDLIGHLESWREQPKGWLTATVEAGDLDPLLRLLGLDAAAGLPDLARALGAAHVTAKLEAQPGSEGSRISLRIDDGLVGGTTIAANGSLSGRLEAPETARLSGSVVLSHPDGARLLEPWGPPQSGRQSTGAARLKVSADGNFSSGLKVTVDGQAFGAAIEAKGTVRRDAQGTAAESDFHLRAEHADRFIAALGLGDGAPQVPLAARGRISAAGGRVSLADAELTLGSRRTTIELQGELGAGRPRIEGSFRASDFSLPWLLGETMLGRGDEAAGAEEGVFPARPFALDRLQQANVRIALEAERLELAPGAALEEARGEIAVEGGRPRIRALTGAFAGGTASLDFEGRDAGEGELAIAGRYAFEGLRLAELLRVNGGAAPLDAVAAVKGTLDGKGRSPAGLVATLAGGGDYAIGAGRLTGLDPEAFAAGLATTRSASELDQLVTETLRSGSMAFAGGSGRFAVADGLASFAPVAVRAAGTDGELRGLIELATGKVDLALRLRLAAMAGAPDLELAHAGPARALARSYDTGALRSYLSVKVLQEGVEKLEELHREHERLAEEEERRAAEEARRRIEQTRRFPTTEDRRGAEEAPKPPAQFPLAPPQPMLELVPPASAPTSVSAIPKQPQSRSRKSLDDQPPEPFR